MALRPPQFTPQEIQQALDDERIKQEDKGGAKIYRVRDTHTIYYFLAKHRMTADFCLFPHTGATTQTRQLNITLSDARKGFHTAQNVITVKIDGNEWRLVALAASPGGAGVDPVTFIYHYRLPDKLVDAIFAAKNGVTLKRQYMYHGGDWKDFEYTIPGKIVRDIQIMYSGCK